MKSTDIIQIDSLLLIKKQINLKDLSSQFEFIYTMNNYSEIVKNNYQILDLFKKLRDRDRRIECSLDQNREKFFRSMKQNKIELERERFNFAVEQDFVLKRGLDIAQGVEQSQQKMGGSHGNASNARQYLRKGAGGQRPQTAKPTAKSVISRPGFGKHDLDTGLSKEKKGIIRNAEGKNKAKHLNEFQKWMRDKDDPLRGKTEQALQSQFKVDVGPGPQSKGLTAQKLECMQQHENQQEAADMEFQRLYANQQLRSKQTQAVDDSHIHPVVRKLFAPDTDLFDDFQHLQYIECIENAEIAEQIVTQLRQFYLTDIINFGHETFKALMRENQDRRLLFQLIRSAAPYASSSQSTNHQPLTFDQFITRVISETKGVKYYCKDDLLDPRKQNVSRSYFEEANVNKMKKVLSAMHKGKTIEEIDPDAITFQCGMNKTAEELFDDDPKFRTLTAIQLQKYIIDDKRVNQWRCEPQCLKSNLNILPRAVQRRNQKRMKEQATHAGKQKFCKTSTFRLDIPLHPNDVKLKELREHEALFKDRKKYVKTLLKKNFDKYRKEDKSAGTFERESPIAVPAGQMDQRSMSQVVAPTQQDGAIGAHGSQTSQINANQRGSRQIGSAVVTPQPGQSSLSPSGKRPTAAPAASVAPSQPPKTQNSQKGESNQLYEVQSIKSGGLPTGNPTSLSHQNSKSNLKAAKKESIRERLKTRTDLLFIRQLRESHQEVKSDPNFEMNLLYDYEREEYFKARKEKVEVVKKKGPRQILHPEMDTVEYKEIEENRRFSKGEFKEQLAAAIEGVKGWRRLKSRSPESIYERKMAEDIGETLDIQTILLSNRPERHQLRHQLEQIENGDFLDQPFAPPPVIDDLAHQSFPNIALMSVFRDKNTMSSQEIDQEREVVKMVTHQTDADTQQLSGSGNFGVGQPKKQRVKSAILGSRGTKGVGSALIGSKDSRDSRYGGIVAHQNNPHSLVASINEQSQEMGYDPSAEQILNQDGLVIRRKKQLVAEDSRSWLAPEERHSLTALARRQAQTKQGSPKRRETSFEIDRAQADRSDYNQDLTSLASKVMKSRQSDFRGSVMMNPGAITSASPNRCISSQNRFVFSSMNVVSSRQDGAEVPGAATTAFATVENAGDSLNLQGGHRRVRNRNMMRSAHNRTTAARGDKPGQDRYGDTASLSTSANFKKSLKRTTVVSERRWNDQTPSLAASGGPLIDRGQNQKCAISSSHQASNNGVSLNSKFNPHGALIPRGGQKARPKSSAGGGFRVANPSRKEHKHTRNQISGHFKFSINSQRDGREMLKSHDIDDIQKFDISLRNLISPDNTQDQKVIRYIKSLGIQVNHQSGQAIVSDSSGHRNVHDFQGQCQTIYEQIHQDPVGSPLNALRGGTVLNSPSPIMQMHDALLRSGLMEGSKGDLPKQNQVHELDYGLPGARSDSPGLEAGGLHHLKNPIYGRADLGQTILLLDQRRGASRMSQHEPSSLRREKPDKEIDGLRTQQQRSQAEIVTEVVYHSNDDDFTNYSGPRLQDTESMVIIDLKCQDDQRTSNLKPDDLLVLNELNHQIEPEILVPEGFEARNVRQSQRSGQDQSEPPSAVPNFVRSLKQQYAGVVHPHDPEINNRYDQYQDEEGSFGGVTRPARPGSIARSDNEQRMKSYQDALRRVVQQTLSVDSKIEEDPTLELLSAAQGLEAAFDPAVEAARASVEASSMLETLGQRRNVYREAATKAVNIETRILSGSALETAMEAKQRRRHDQITGFSSGDPLESFSGARYSGRSGQGDGDGRYVAGSKDADAPLPAASHGNTQRSVKVSQQRTVETGQSPPQSALQQRWAQEVRSDDALRSRILQDISAKEASPQAQPKLAPKRQHRESSSSQGPEAPKQDSKEAAAQNQFKDYEDDPRPAAKEPSSPMKGNQLLSRSPISDYNSSIGAP